ncbi:MAG: MBL fold metallo-hydrolase [Candidatus Riflebacteria bacterium]|nr:MBL fold metallo-hydrolase [Candidatus Riflebacteria bacterium]
MNISFFGAAKCVTGSCYKISYDDVNFLVDCGMFQGSKSLRTNNYLDFYFDPASIDFVLLTHAHIDHTGLLPKLVKAGFKGPVYATEVTIDLLKAMLPDSARIQVYDVMLKNKRNERRGLPPVEPIYDESDAANALNLMRPVKLHVSFEPAKGCKATYYEAGHVLGSSFIKIELKNSSGEERSIIFSGDMGGENRPIIEDPDKFPTADFLVMESTYGNRTREEVDSDKRLADIAAIVNRTEERGGKVIIPAFALERTQDLIYDLIKLKKRKQISSIPVIVDSPLASEITRVFIKYPNHYDEEATEVLEGTGNIFDHSDISFTSSVDDSKALNERDRVIILSANGMCDAGRIKHHLIHNLWNPNNTVVFVGFQAEGTLGRLIIDGEETVRINGKEIKVNAEITQIDGYSGHADQTELFEQIETMPEKPGHIFVTHGESEASEEFAKLIEEKYQISASVPSMFESVNLLDIQTSVLKEHETPVLSDSHNLYARFMLELADYMRAEESEEKRYKKLESFLKKLEK